MALLGSEALLLFTRALLSGEALLVLALALLGGLDTVRCVKTFLLRLALMGGDAFLLLALALLGVLSTARCITTFRLLTDALLEGGMALCGKTFLLLVALLLLTAGKIMGTNTVG